MLLYLEGMHVAANSPSSVGGSRPQSKYIQHDIMDVPPPNPNDWKPPNPDTVRSPQRDIHTPLPKPGGGNSQLEDLARSELSYGLVPPPKAEDARSNEQEGVRTPSIRSHAELRPEPGPEDEPGPHYVSYGSGPSFGNFGPLPRFSFDAHGMPLHPPMSPVRGQFYMSNP